MKKRTETRDGGQVILSKVESCSKAESMSLFELCQAYCKEHQLKHKVVEHPSPGTRVILMGFEGRDHMYRCVLQACEDRTQVTFYAMAPEEIPTGRRREVMEFITRVNYILRMGNFEIDLNGGDLRYKNAIDLEGAVASTDTIHVLVGTALTTMDRHYGWILRIVKGEIGAKNAMAAILG